MTSQKIVVFCNANETEGMGHFYRCLYYSRFLKSPHNNICFYGNFNGLAQVAIKNYGFQSKIADSSDLINCTSNIDWLLVDTYLFTQREINELASKYKTIFIDDFGSRDYTEAYAVINFTINATNYSYNSKYKLLGPKYFPYKEEFLSVREKNLKRRRPLRKAENQILILFSSTSLDKNKIKSFIKAIDSFYTDGLITLVLNQQIGDVVLQNNQFAHYQKVEKMEQLYQEATLLFSGGGLVKYEAAFCAIPNFSFAINQLQQAETIQLAECHLTMDIGTYYDFHLENSIKKIRQFHQSIFAEELFYKRSEKYFQPGDLKASLTSLLEDNYGY